MGDITITVGGKPDLNYADFENAINSMASKLNAKPIKIKVVVDSKSLKTMRSQIKNITKSVRSVTMPTVNGNTSRNTSSRVNIASQQAQSLRKGTSELVEQTKRYEKASKTASKITTKYYDSVNGTTTTVRQAQGKNGKYQTTSKDIKEVRKTTAQLTKEYANADKKVAQALANIQAKKRALANVDDGKSTKQYGQLGSYEGTLKSLRAELSNTGDFTAFENGFTRLEAKIASTNAKAAEWINTQRNMAKASKDSAKAAKDEEAAIKKYFTLTQQYRSTLDKFTAAKGSRRSGAAYQGIADGAKSLEDAFESFNNKAIDLDTFQKKVAGLNIELLNNTDIINKNGDNRRSLMDRLGGLAGKFTSWLSASQAVMAAVDGMKKLFNASVEINGALTQLKIVTGSSDAQMTQFFTNSSSLAKELGQSITDVLGSVETFSRLGYNLTDSSELAKYSNILANVANTDSDTATTGLTSIIKGYDMDVSQAEHVSDVLVKVGQEYAISAEELMAAFQRGGAALHASGTDFEKSAALFAATNASLQNAETTGTMWKTVSARIRGATTELEAMGEETEGVGQGLSKYRDEIIALSGVDIMKDDNTYKDMYEIFTSLAEVWDSMEDVSQARVAEILGGTRNTSGIMSTITNIKDATGAYETAVNSVGAAEKAQAEIMDSIQGRIGVFKASFQELGSDIFSSDLTKGIVDFGTTAIDVIDRLVDSIGALPTLLATVGGSMAAFSMLKNVA